MARTKEQDAAYQRERRRRRRLQKAMERSGHVVDPHAACDKTIGELKTQVMSLASKLTQLANDNLVLSNRVAELESEDPLDGLFE